MAEPARAAHGSLVDGGRGRDVNGDSVPDFLMLNKSLSVRRHCQRSHSPAPYTLTYTAYPILGPPGGYSGFGASIAMATSTATVPTRLRSEPPEGERRTQFHRLYSSTNLGQVVCRTCKRSRNQTAVLAVLGSAIAVGNIDGNPGNDLVVGAPGAARQTVVSCTFFRARCSNPRIFH
jgi:hypothetical protein